MNQTNLEIVRDLADDFCVTSGDPHLYCDGRIMCIAGALAEKPWVWKSHTSTKVVDIAEQALVMWGQIKAGDNREPSRAAGIFGALGEPGYIRRLEAGDVATAWIQERYARIFAPDAEFRITPEHSDSVTVYEDGALVGIVMQVRIITPEEWPAVPYLADDVLYHECPDCDCD